MPSCICFSHERVLWHGGEPRDVVHDLLAVVVEDELGHAVGVDVREHGAAAADDLEAPGPDHGEGREPVAREDLAVARGRLARDALVERVHELVEERHEHEHAERIEHLLGRARDLRGERTGADAHVGLLHDRLVVGALVLAEPPDGVECVERQDADDLLDAVHELVVEAATVAFLGALHEARVAPEEDPEHGRRDDEGATGLGDVVARLAVVGQEGREHVHHEGREIEHGAKDKEARAPARLGAVHEDLDDLADRLLGGRHLDVAAARQVEDRDEAQQTQQRDRVVGGVAVGSWDRANAVETQVREHGVAQRRADVGHGVMEAEEDAFLLGRRVGRELVAAKREHHRAQTYLRRDAEVEPDRVHDLGDALVLEHGRQRRDDEHGEADRVDRRGTEQRLELADAFV